MRLESLIGALAGTIIVGYFTSTTPTIAMSLLLGTAFLLLGIQLLAAAQANRKAGGSSITSAAPLHLRKRMQVLCYVTLTIAVFQTIWSTGMLFLAQNPFSLFGILCGVCFIGTAVHAKKSLYEKRVDALDMHAPGYRL